MVFTLEKSQPAANHLVLPGVSWEKFEKIENSFADKVRIDGRMAIATTQIGLCKIPSGLGYFQA